MDIHHNARSCPHSRALMVDRVQRGDPVVRVAADLGVSERTVYKWLARYRRQGLEGLRDRSSRPHCSPRQAAAAVVDQIVQLRHRRMVSAEIAARLDLARSTVARTLSRRGLGRLKALDPAQPPRRYEKEHPGELLHLDIKKLGRIDGIGHRITGIRRRRRPRPGWEFVHVCVDDASRLAYLKVLPDERKESAIAFLQRALSFFHQRGVQPLSILTDNGSCYRAHAFNNCCHRHGLRHLYTRPYRPQTNGKAERFIQTMLREWAYRIPYRSSRERSRWLPRWLHFYNHHRMHQSLANLPPISRLPLLNNVMRMHT